MIIFYFLLTFVIELVIISLFLKKKSIDITLKVLFINLFTWPLAQIFYGLEVNQIAIELGVFIAEGILIFVLFKLNRTKAFLLLFVANLASWIIGMFF